MSTLKDMAKMGMIEFVPSVESGERKVRITASGQQMWSWAKIGVALK